MREAEFRSGLDRHPGPGVPLTKEVPSLTREAVEMVIREFDQSSDAFMRKHGFAANFDYVVFRPGEQQRYPAKAIFLVAYSSIPGNPSLTVRDHRDTFRDTEGGPIHTEFRRLGYEVENRRFGSKEVLAERIRQHLIAHYIAPARQRGDHLVTIRAGDVHKELDLTNQMPNVCQAIEGKKFRNATNLGEPEILSGPARGRGGTWFTASFCPPVNNRDYRLVTNRSLRDSIVIQNFAPGALTGPTNSGLHFAEWREPFMRSGSIGTIPTFRRFGSDENRRSLDRPRVRSVRYCAG